MRTALLGSPGRGIPPRLPLRMVTAVGATKTGAGATYAAVVAGHKLILVRPQDAAPVAIVTFTGAENSQATFHAAINAQIGPVVGGVVPGGAALASNAAGQTRLTTTQLGAMSIGTTVSAASDADVLASLGLAAGAFVAPAAPSVMRMTGFAGGRFFGNPAISGTHFQHGTVIRRGGGSALLVVDRLAAGNVAADSSRFAPRG